MAHMTSFPFIRHLRGEPTSFVMHFRDGHLKRSGRGLAFWFLPLGASLTEVPLADRDESFLVSSHTRDFQEVAVQGTITYRVSAPDVLADRVDFSIDTRTGAYREKPLDRVADLIRRLAQQLAHSYVIGTPLREVLDDGLPVLQRRLEEGLTADATLPEMGIEVVAVRVAQVSPTADMAKALQMPTREKIQQAADEATFARRALAVEKERAIEENELTNRIELARREEQLIDQEGQNGRRRAEEEAASRRIQAEARASDMKLDAEAKAEFTEKVEAARVAAERERMDIYRTLPAEALLGLAARELASKLTKIEHLNVSNDLVGPLLQRLAYAGANVLEKKED
jgi:regulator of protease activity HflC (stomatin/prohibitin superfamily)